MEQPPAAAIHLWHHKSERQAGDIAEVELFTRMRKFLFPLDRGSNDPEMRTNLSILLYVGLYKSLSQESLGLDGVLSTRLR